MKKYFLTFFLLINIHFLKSENDYENVKPKSIFEPFFNISNALVKFTGNQNNQSIILESPFLMGCKLRLNKKNALRIGTDFNFSRRDELLGTLVRSTSNRYYNLNVGYEKRYHISKSFDLYYGLDLRYFFEEVNTKVIENQNNQNIVVNNIINARNGPGTALHAGFVWNITPRISVFTETSVSAFYINQYNYLISGGFKTVIEDKIEYNFIPYAPNSIFFLIKI